ncbi:hypothetical protein BH11BAC1_BH11BAC1_09760 [soil metagenome]
MKGFVACRQEGVNEHPDSYRECFYETVQVNESEWDI